MALKYFNRDHFSNLHSRSDLARDNLFKIQKLLESSPGNRDLLSQENAALQDLIKFSTAEESFTRQKSRTPWISEGDQNTRFFHHCMRNRINQNKLVSVSLDDGTQIYHPVDIQVAAANYFQTLFSDSQTAAVNIDLMTFVNKSLPLDQATVLESPISSTEIKDTIFRMKPDKAPGTDGFTAFFSRKCGILWAMMLLLLFALSLILDGY